MENKNCHLCSLTKEVNFFYLDKRNNDGFSSGCKDCLRKRSRDHHFKNREKILEYQKEYRSNNRSYYNQKSKEWNIKTGYGKKYQQERLKSDDFFRFKNRLRTLLRISITKQGYSKKSKAFDILGCDYDFFIKYISSKFKEGMSWENHGEWHLDHIKPISLAKEESEVIALNHYTNFQPMWAIDNLKKYNKFNETYGGQDEK